MKRHSACDEIVLFLTTIAINTSVKDLLFHIEASNVYKVAPRSN